MDPNKQDLVTLLAGVSLFSGAPATHIDTKQQIKVTPHAKTATLVFYWRELADTLRAEGCDQVAATRDRCATELETALHTEEQEVLSIDMAAKESGYNAEYLRRLLRSNPALNAGRPGKPLIRRCDLPRKATKSLVRRLPELYDARADAQSLMGRQGVN